FYWGNFWTASSTLARGFSGQTLHGQASTLDHATQAGMNYANSISPTRCLAALAMDSSASGFLPSQLFHSTTLCRSDDTAATRSAAAETTRSPRWLLRYVVTSSSSSPTQ